MTISYLGGRLSVRYKINKLRNERAIKINRSPSRADRYADHATVILTVHILLKTLVPVRLWSNIFSM